MKFSIFNVFKTDDSEVKYITVEELRAMINRNEDFTIVDVRTPGEFTHEHIARSVNIPLKAMEGSEETHYGVFQHKNRLVICCDSGAKSLRARALFILRGANGKDIAVLRGGVKAWVRSGGVLISD